MDAAERTRFMSEVVMPTMRALFVEADAERFADFSCGSCHGRGAADGTFSMPSSDVPALGGAPGSTGEEHKQRMTDFMRTIVKPKMAELLGDSELRCSNCHPTAQAD
jgi:mono/diheme cytochrome c family protein